jgi:hypothetical protein
VSHDPEDDFYESHVAEEEPLLAAVLLWAAGEMRRLAVRAWDRLAAALVPHGVFLGELTNDQIDGLDESAREE